MSDLISKIRSAQIRAGEDAVCDHLREMGLLDDQKPIAGVHRPMTAVEVAEDLEAGLNSYGSCSLAAKLLRQQRAEIERLARKNAAYASLDSKHTPGPWTVPYKEFSKVKAENGAVIATCHKLTNLTNLEANARLLAAAPDLLEVCRRLAAVNVFSADNDVAQIIMMARDAVEKATGEKA